MGENDKIVRVTLPFRAVRTSTYRGGSSFVSPVPRVWGKARLLWFFHPDDPSLRVVIVLPPYVRVNVGRVPGSKGGGRFFIEGSRDVLRSILLKLAELGFDVEDGIKAVDRSAEFCEYVCPDGSVGLAPCEMAWGEDYVVAGWRVKRFYDPEGEDVEEWDKEMLRDIERGVGVPFVLPKNFIERWGVVEYRAVKYDNPEVIKLWFRSVYRDPYSGLSWDEWEEQIWVRDRRIETEQGTGGKHDE